jgi:hypothetical protein
LLLRSFEVTVHLANETGWSKKTEVKPMTNKQRHQPRSRNLRHRPSRKARLVNQGLLVDFLLEEIQYGSSLTGLYARMLVNTLLAEEAELRRRYPDLASERDSKRSTCIPRVRSTCIPRVRSKRAPC